MLNFITQQRRGTTQEWSKSLVVPHEGEIVLEECRDGSIKVKIGNGRQLFADLPYADKSVVDALDVLSRRVDEAVKYLGDPDYQLSKEVIAKEIIDARVTEKQTYSTLGAAIRGVESEINDLAGSLSEFIGSQAVDGLYYDTNGDVGLKQPYMLYLTANDEIIETSGVQIISGAGGGGGSSQNTLTITRITPDPFYFTVNDKAVVKFNFSGKDSSGEDITHASATWKVDGKVVGYQEIKDGYNEYSFNNLKVGKSKIFLSIVDDVGSVATKTWEANNIELKVTSTFDDKKKYSVDDYLIFSCSPYGAVDKTIHILLDGEEVKTEVLSANTSGDVYSYEFPKQTHGSHYLNVYTTATINDVIHYSNTISKDIIRYDGKSLIPVIGCSYQTLEVKQYETVDLEYYVYDPTTESPVVKIYVDDQLMSTRTLDSSVDSYSFQSSDVGEHIVKLICSNSQATIEKIITISVESIGVKIEPVLAGLVFDFNPVGKSNADVSADIAWEQNNIQLSVSDNFDWENGGYQFDIDADRKNIDGSYHFCVKAGTTATFNYELFGSEAKTLGKEVKIIFKTCNVVDLSNPFVSCFDESVNVGLQMYPHDATVSYQGGAVSVAYSEDDIIEYEFNITPGSSNVPMVMCYEDGVSTRPSVYNPESHNFIQSSKKFITVGSPYCDVHIYRVKAYQKSLESKEVLQNFIADARTPDEMLSRYLRNQIYDSDTKALTPESLANACPWLRVYKLSAPYFTNDKEDKVENTSIQQIFKSGDPVLDNWVAYNCMHSGQGTSSNEYGAAGRNLDFIMNSSGLEDDKLDPKEVYIELGDGTITDKITLTRTSVPTNYLNAKVNIASSNNITNALLARHYNRNNPYRRPFVRDDSVNTSYIKDTMEFYNCAIFIQETDPDLTKHREFADTDWHFYAIGNIGDSKKTDKTRLTDPSDKYECCIEILDVGKPLSGFPEDTMINAMGVDSKTGEYIWAKDENLGILYEKQEDGSYSLTEDETVDLNKTYYVDILENEPINKTYTYDWRYISNKKDPDVVNFCKQRWIEFYRFLTTSTDEEFKSNFENYFVKDSALYYYLFTLRYCMVDNRAKNTFWHYGKTADGTRKWDLSWDYDNDTSLGLNNSGVQAYRYGLEDIDSIENSEVFRQSDSTFFNRVRQNFKVELATMYNRLDNSGAGTWNAQSLISESDSMQNEFPEELWRLDIERKYIRTYTKSFINGGPWKAGLTQMCNGRMKYHRRQWERNQEQYISSKFITDAIFNDSTAVSLRGPAQTLSGDDYTAVPPKYEFTLTPRLYTYLNVRYGTTNGEIINKRAEPGKPEKMTYNGTYNDLLYIGNGDAISDLGDLSSFYLEKVSLGNAPKLRGLKLGNNTVGYKNTHFEEWSSGNPLLETLNIENVEWKGSANKTLNLDDMLSLQTIKAFGSNITGVVFAKGSKLNYAELPKTITTLSLKKLPYLSTENIKIEDNDYNSILDLIVDGCPNVDAIELLNKCTKLNRARLIDVVLENVTYEYFYNTFIHRLLPDGSYGPLKGISASDEQTSNAVITGVAKFNTLTGSQYNELKTRYPELEIQFKTLRCNVEFRDSQENTLIEIPAVGNNNILPSIEDPVVTNSIDKPLKGLTDKYEYDFYGWSTYNDGIISEKSPLIDIANDLIVYPTFTETIRSYKVTYKNNNGTTLYVEDVNYDDYPEYDVVPVKENTSAPDAFRFKGWVPSQSVVVTGDRECYATYDVDLSSLYTLTSEDVYYDVTDIGVVINALINTESKLINVPDTLKTPQGDDVGSIVELNGFGSCSIEYIVLPNSLKVIGDSCFYRNELTELLIPENVTTIHANAFGSCNKLAQVTYNATSAKVVYSDNQDVRHPFNNCYNNIGYDVIIGVNVQSIPDNLFREGTNLSGNLRTVRSLRFEQGSKCNRIGNYAFRYSKLETLDLPNMMQEIGTYAFENARIKHLTLPEGFNKLEAYAFGSCPLLKTVFIPSSVSSIASTAFFDCPEVDFTIESGSIFVWESSCLINSETFTLLMGKSDAVVPLNRGLKTIAEYCFHSRDIENIELPDTVTSLKSYAFYGCKKLKTLKLSQNIQRIENFCIYNTSVSELHLPETLQAIGSYGIANNAELLNIDVPALVRDIGFKAFKECSNLTTAMIRSSFVTLQKPDNDSYNLFIGCEKLSNVSVNWNSDGTKVDNVTNNISYVSVNADAPWFAGTDKDGRKLIDVTVHYADNDIIYSVN